MEKKKVNIFKIIVIMLNVISIGIILAMTVNVSIERKSYNEDSETSVIKTFNSNFTLYEGKEQSAVQMRNLVSRIKSSNNVEENKKNNHLVTINSLMIEDIKDVKLNQNIKYTVELDYGEDNYISNIRIYDNEGNAIEVNGYKIERTKNEENKNYETKTTFNLKNGIKLLSYYILIFIAYLAILIFSICQKMRIQKKYRGEEQKNKLEKWQKTVLWILLAIALTSGLISCIIFLN